MRIAEEVIRQMLDALGSCRVMAKAENGNYTKEVTPRRIRDAIEAGEGLLMDIENRDALLRQSLALLDKQWTCDGLWSLEDCQELAETIKEELSK